MFVFCVMFTTLALLAVANDELAYEPALLAAKYALLAYDAADVMFVFCVMFTTLALLADA